MIIKYDSIYSKKGNYIRRYAVGYELENDSTLITFKNNHPSKLDYYAIHLKYYPKLIPYLKQL